MQKAKNFVIRASWTSYLFIWVPVGLLAVVYVAGAFRGIRDAWIILGILMFLGFLGTGCLLRIYLALTSDAIVYRGLLRSASIPIQDISTVQGIMRGRGRSAMGFPEGPNFLLIVEPASGRETCRLMLNMKLFSKRDLNKFFNTLETCDIPVRLDPIVAKIFHSN